MAVGVAVVKTQKLKLLVLTFAFIGVSSPAAFSEHLIHDVKGLTGPAYHGETWALVNLAWKNEIGEREELDDVKFFNWFGKIVGQRDPATQDSLGVMYGLQADVLPNEAEIFIWYHKLAEQGDAKAQYNLAIMYDLGEVVRHNDEESVKWYRKAAVQGDVKAQYNLGVMYDMGEGVAHDDKEAVKWYRKVAEQGYDKAQTTLGVM